ncbi:MAG: diguanylate cyclase, partial [Oscillospiraceae bacterium]
HLEITETAYSKNQKQLISAVEKVKKCGFIIEMDDFGSGYSSLNVINQMPVDILKLDVKFLKHSSSSTHNNSILKFVIDLARDLNFDVIAEGIETESDIKTLEDNGCRYGQGYYFSKPVPEKEFEELLLKTKIQHTNDTHTPKNTENSRNEKKLLDTLPFGIARFTKDMSEIVFSNKAFDDEFILDDNSQEKQVSIEDFLGNENGNIIRKKAESLFSDCRQDTLNFNIKLSHSGYQLFHCTMQCFDDNESIIQITFLPIAENNMVSCSEIQAILGCLPQGIIKFNGNNSEVSFVGGSFFDIVGYSEIEFSEKFGGNFEELIYDVDREKVKKQINSQLSNGFINKLKFRIQTKNGDIKWIECKGRTYCEKDNKKCVYMSVSDITEIKELKEQAQINKERYESILPYTKDVIFEWDMKTNKVYTTDTFENKFGYRLDEKNLITEIRANEYILDEDWHCFYNLIAEICSGKCFGQCEARVKKNDGTYIWCKITSTSIKDDNDFVVKVVGVLSDISEHKEKLENVQKIADTDYLTQVYNRTGFIKYINEYLEISNTLSAMIIVDIDYFKNVNDTYGHKVGDEILKNIAGILKNQAKREDIVGRLGGDEFVVFLKNINDVFEAEMFAKSICKQVEKHTLTTCSIGVTIDCGSHLSFDEFYLKADTALYKSKENGRNQYTL